MSFTMVTFDSVSVDVRSIFFVVTICLKVWRRAPYSGGLLWSCSRNPKYVNISVTIFILTYFVVAYEMLDSANEIMVHTEVGAGIFGRRVDGSRQVLHE